MATFSSLLFRGTRGQSSGLLGVNTVQLYNKAVQHKLSRADFAVVGKSHNTYNKPMND